VRFSNRMISYSTVQELIDGRYALSAYCHNSRCHNHFKLDLLQLRKKLGPDHSAMHEDIAPKLRCQKCKGKAVGLILSRRRPNP
jgi:hypothetical protein